MKPLVLLLLFALVSVAEGRAFNQNECRGLAATAGAAALLRTEQAPLMKVLAALDDAIDESDGSLVRFDGDAQLITQLVIVTYNSNYTSEQAARIVYDMCNRHDLSISIKEV
jgi:hypothetical protein